MGTRINLFASLVPKEIRRLFSILHRSDTGVKDEIIMCGEHGLLYKVRSQRSEVRPRLEPDQSSTICAHIFFLYWDNPDGICTLRGGNIPMPWAPLHAINAHGWKRQRNMSSLAHAAVAAWREYPTNRDGGTTESARARDSKGRRKEETTGLTI